MSPTVPLIWLVGQVYAVEFVPAMEWLKGQASCTSIGNSVPDSGDEPNAILFCMTRPGQISHAQVEELHRSFPLARLLALVGPWCEGEVRSGRPWPGVTRIYWHQWQPRLIEEVQGLAAAGRRRLPRTASEVDRLLAGAAKTQASSQPALVGIVAPRKTDFESLALVLAPAGHHAVWIVPQEPLPVLRVDALVIDGGADVAAAGEMLVAARSRLGQVPALLLGSFLRPEEAQLAAAMPQTAFITKPFLVSDLLTRLAELLTASDSATNRSTRAAA